MNEDTLYKLTNPSFDFEWNGAVYHVKKANLQKVVQYQQRARELVEQGSKGTEIKLAAYALYLVLLDVKPDVTEQEVLDNTPGDIDVLDLLVRLGFLNPTRITTALQKLKQTGEKYLSQSQTELDGHQDKSQSLA